MQLSIIIVNWNSAKLLKKCLESLQKNGLKNMEIIVVDNNSTDNSVKIIQKFPKVKLIVNKENLGFAKACNQGAKVSMGKILLFLNPDTQVLPKSLDNMIWFLAERPDVAAIGPMLLNKDGTIQNEGYYLKIPSVLQVLFFYTKLHSFSIKSRLLKKLFLVEKIGNVTKAVEQIPGATLMIKKNIFDKIGAFSEKYFLWFEDVDLCFRLTKGRYKLYYFSKAQIQHIGGGSFAKWEDEDQKRKLFLKSLKLFFFKNKSPLESSIVNLILFLDKLL